MDERLVPIDFYFEAVADADNVWLRKVPVQLTIVAVEYTIHTVGATVTAAGIDIQADLVTPGTGVDIITAIDLAAFSADSMAEWLSTHIAGGEEDPVDVPAGSILEIDLNITGGGTLGLQGTIWALVGGLKSV